jgi:hypothetical protein
MGSLRGKYKGNQEYMPFEKEFGAILMLIGFSFDVLYNKQ